MASWEFPQELVHSAEIPSLESRRVVRTLLDHENRNAQPGMEHIEQEVISIDVVDVTIIGIEPFRRPPVHNRKPEAGELEPRLAFNDDGTVHDEGVLPAKAGAELFIRDVRTLAGWTPLLAPTFGFLPVLLMGRLGFLTGRLGVF